MEESPALQYVLLGSLKELIASAAAPGAPPLPAAPFRALLLVLLARCEGEEGVRSVVAECLGKLTAAERDAVLPELVSRLASPSPQVRATVVAALKFAVMALDRAAPVGPADAALASALARLPEALRDSDRHVRRAAVQLLTSASHCRPRMVAGLLPAVLPALYEQCAVRPDLIRTMDLGPFKHTVDDGLELRKATFECLDDILSTLPEALTAGPLLRHLTAGLGDVEADVKLTCHEILGKLTRLTRSPLAPAVAGALGELLPPLEATLSLKLKDDAVKQEVDRHEDLLRSALKAVDALSRMRDVEGAPRFADTLVRVVGAGPLALKYAAVKAEADAALRGDALAAEA